MYFNSKKSPNLFGLRDNFDFLRNLYIKNRLPKVLMLSGKKGSGKSTLINHLMYSIFDKENYKEDNNDYNFNSIFYNQLLDNNFILIPTFKNSFQEESLRMISKKILKLDKNEKLFINSLKYISEFHPSGFPRPNSLIETKNFYLKKLTH